LYYLYVLLLGVLIGKSSGSPSGGGGGDASSVVGIFDDGSLSIGSGGDNDNVFGVFNGNDDSGGKLDLLVDFFNVDDMNSFF
jgi:hypothetical protein